MYLFLWAVELWLRDYTKNTSVWAEISKMDLNHSNPGVDSLITARTSLGWGVRVAVCVAIRSTCLDL